MSVNLTPSLTLDKTVCGAVTLTATAVEDQLAATSLPIFQSTDQNLMLLQNKWSSIINPTLVNPSLQCNILSKVALTSGTNTINHLLGRTLQGYRIVRQRGPASIYDSQDSNQQPQLTLVLVSSAAVTVDLEVF